MRKAASSGVLTSLDLFWCREIASTPEEHGTEEYRFNDGKVSPGGVYLGGRMHKTGAEVDGKHGHWYKLEWHREDGKSRLVQVGPLNKKSIGAVYAPSTATVAAVAIGEISAQQRQRTACSVGVWPSAFGECDVQWLASRHQM